MAQEMPLFSSQPVHTGLPVEEDEVPGIMSTPVMMQLQSTTDVPTTEVAEVSTQYHRIEVGGFTKVSAQFYLVDGGKTKREFPFNLISAGREGWCKWRQEQSNQSWVMLEFTQGLTFDAIGFVSANDPECDDPDEVKV